MIKYSKDFLIKLYKMMVKIRVCEESFVEPILRGEIKCPVHLYSGQEAIATGVCAALKRSDYIFGTHRSHGHYLAKGGDIRELVAEVYGKERGCSKGRGGSMHLICPEYGLLGAAPIVAGTISLALGAALAAQIRKDKRVTVSFFGDGAAGEGVLYESLNFAALKKLPLIFVCENNFYSTHLPIRECRPNSKIADIARPFGVKTRRIFGNDVLLVHETAKEAVFLCRTGKGPVFIEALTYRFRGHVGADDNIQGSHTDIRPKEEICKWQKKDPIFILGKYMLKNNILSDAEILKIKNDLVDEITRLHYWAKKSAYPKADSLRKYVFKK